MTEFFALTTAQQITSVIMLGLLFAFSAFVVVVMVLVLKPSKVTRTGVHFGSVKRSKAPEDLTSIMHHKLFKFLEQCETTGALSLGSSDKALVLSNFLKIKFKVLYDGYWDFFQKSEKNGYDGLSKLPNAVNEWILDYEAKVEKMKTRTSKGELCGLPRCAVTKFAHWHKRHAHQLFEDYDNALSDRIFVSKRERAFAMCGATYFALRETIQDANITLEYLNGDFDRELESMLGKCND
jgi:hypothetical protein